MDTFEAFSAAHIAALIALAVSILLIVLLRKPLRGERAGRMFRLLLAAVLIACEIGLHTWYIRSGEWGVYSLPFQLCSMMVWVSAYVLLTGDRRLHDAVFFLGLLGALQAMLTPNLDYTYPHFRYFHFFIAHIAIIAASLYLLAVERYRPTLRSVFRALVWLHVLAIPAAVTNALTDANYMFLAGKPSTPSLLDLLAPWPWYLLQLELVAAAMCLLLWGAVRLLDWLVVRQRAASES